MYVDMKRCSKCEQTLPATEFNKHRTTRDRLAPTCRTCMRVYRRDWYAANREGVMAKANAYYWSHREQAAASNKAYRKTHTEARREGKLKSTFGITSDEYGRLLSEQDHRCAICARHELDFNRRFDVDHDHGCCPGRQSCGKCVRGLLCANCNMALGLFDDDTNRIVRAREYLLKANADCRGAK